MGAEKCRKDNPQMNFEKLKSVKIRMSDPSTCRAAEAHSHSLICNTGGEKQKRGGHGQNWSENNHAKIITDYFLMRTYYLYAYTVFKNVMDRSVCD